MLEDAEDVECELSDQIETLESQIKEKDDELEALKKTLGSVQSTSCVKDVKIAELDTALAKEKKAKVELEAKLVEATEREQERRRRASLSPSPPPVKNKALPKLKPKSKSKTIRRGAPSDEVKPKIEDQEVKPVASTSGSASSNTLVGSSSSSNSSRNGGVDRAPAQPASRRTYISQALTALDVSNTAARTSTSESSLSHLAAASVLNGDVDASASTSASTVHRHGLFSSTDNVAFGNAPASTTTASTSGGTKKRDWASSRASSEQEESSDEEPLSRRRKFSSERREISELEEQKRRVLSSLLSWK
jgi:hypothetical protein